MDEMHFDSAKIGAVSPVYALRNLSLVLLVPQNRS